MLAFTLASCQTPSIKVDIPWVRKIIMVHYYFVSLEYNNINAVFVHVIYCINNG